MASVAQAASRFAPVAQRQVSESLLTNHNSVDLVYDSLDEAFPKVDPQHKPLGTCGIFQLRMPKRRTKGGIIIVDDTRSTEYYNTQIAKVIALGPLCFKVSRQSELMGQPSEVLVPFAEGPWFEVGQYVRLPKYGGDRWAVPYTFTDYDTNPENDRKEKVTVKAEVIFAIFKVKDVISLVTGDPLTVKAFLD